MTNYINNLFEQDAEDEINICLFRLGLMNDSISDAAYNTSDAQAKLDLCNIIITYSDCISRYLETLKTEFDKIAKTLNGLRLTATK